MIGSDKVNSTSNSAGAVKCMLSAYDVLSLQNFLDCWISRIHAI